MSQRLDGRRAIVTGAAGAFGAATVAAFKTAGADVAGLDLKPSEDVIACDVRDEDQVRSAVSESVSRLGGLDLLVNCAGIGVPLDAGAMPGQTAEAIVDVNLWGQWRTTAAAMPDLLASRGRVIFVASGLAYGNVPYASAYAVSKRALSAYADALRVEYGDSIGITTVYPGYVDTPIHRASDEAGVNVGELVRAEQVGDIVATILRAATARRAPRDRGTTLIGHLQLLACRHLPALTDQVIRRRFLALARSGKYDGVQLVQPALRRQGLASSTVDGARERTVTTQDGVPLHVELAGPDDAPVTVAFLHGWCLSSETYRNQWRDLAARSPVPIRMIRHDHRGHGRSGAAPEGTTTIAQLADDFVQVVQSLDMPGPLVLVGHSMGGMTAMALAERHPEFFAERVAGAVIVNSAADELHGTTLGLPPAIARLVLAGLPRELERRAAAATRRGARRRRTDAAIAKWLLYGDSARPADVRLARELIGETPAATVAGFYRSLGEHSRLDAVRALAGVPVRILAGDRDRLIPVERARVLAGAIPGSSLLVVRGAGHMIPLERPELLTGEIVRVLEAVRAPAVAGS